LSPRQKIGKAGENIKDQDRHNILLVDCWLSRSGLVITHCAPTFVNPELTSPIFHFPNGSHSKQDKYKPDQKHCLRSPKRKLCVLWTIYDTKWPKNRAVWVYFELANSPDETRSLSPDAVV